MLLILELHELSLKQICILLAICQMRQSLARMYSLVADVAQWQAGRPLGDTTAQPPATNKQVLDT